MELSAKKRLLLISGRAHPELAEEVAALLEVDLIDANLSDFANGEIYCKFAESVRGGDVFILQTHTGTAD
ncbi:ribose-phosphate pyrophosphokinase-like domain-containing protein, partial [bacterium]|nr:ribose-phosphate pyrophosphokinase-like domain-containing protein [bacterium]